MKKEFEKLLEFWKNNEGTGKLFNFKFLEYKKGYLKLEAEFGPSTLNPNKNVQGGQMTSMLDDATSILLVLDSGGKSYPNSTNLNSLHHRPLFQGKVTVVAETI
ncbi:PaaI family thioesterase, partial [Flavobacteriaceae bacterium]|nr:PaaI family thioesterase [Flavobacteriaceae bacterium]